LKCTSVPSCASSPSSSSVRDPRSHARVVTVASSPSSRSHRASSSQINISKYISLASSSLASLASLARSRTMSRTLMLMCSSFTSCFTSSSLISLASSRRVALSVRRADRVARSVVRSRRVLTRDESPLDATRRDAIGAPRHSTALARVSVRPGASPPRVSARERRETSSVATSSRRDRGAGRERARPRRH
jgi:hypothetical protein